MSAKKNTQVKQLPISILRPPATQAGEYTETLEQWGALPEVLTLPDAARFIAHKCQQNPAAILKVLESAVQDSSIRFWGLLSNGEWEEGLMRVFHRTTGKPRLNQETGKFRIGIAHNGKLHSEAMGVNPRDVVALLAKRGRKIPDELRHFLIESAASGQAGAASNETPKQRRARWLKELEQEQAVEKIGALARVHKRELERNPKADRSNLGKQIEKARQERVAMPIKPAGPHQPTADNPFGQVVATRYVDGKPVS